MFALLDKLGKKSSNLKVHRWFRKHDSDKPFKSNVSYDHNDKKCNVSFETCIILDPAGIKNVCSKVSQSEGALSKGAGIDRKNNNALKKMNEVERLGFKLATTAYSPDRLKRGVEGREMLRFQST